MNILQVKQKVMAYLDEIDSPSLLANIGDYINKMYPIIDSVQKELAFMVCPVKKEQEVTAESGELALPDDLYEITGIKGEDGGTLTLYYRDNRTLKNVPDGTYTVSYNAIPATIAAGTPDTYQLEIDEEGCEALIYGVCALICINDEPDLYVIYKNNYDIKCQNIIERKQSHSFVTITGGIDL